MTSNRNRAHERKTGCVLIIPSNAMRLTVLAAGTSIPDALTPIAVARDEAADMAIFNAIGSNVFDIHFGLGVPWFLGALTLQEKEGQLAPIVLETSSVTRVFVPIIMLFSILVVFIGILVSIISIMVVFIGILIALKWTMRPLLGYILCGIYAAFVAYTFLYSTERYQRLCRSWRQPNGRRSVQLIRVIVYEVSRRAQKQLAVTDQEVGGGRVL